MGLKKGIYYGFSGYRSPAIPRAPRSIRKRASCKKIVDDTKVSAFELLATVAGTLLQESESSSASSNATAVNNQPAFGMDLIKREPEDVDNIVKADCINQPSCEGKDFSPRLALQDCDHGYTSEEFLHGKSDAILECVSVITSSNYPEKVNSDLKLANSKSRNLYESGEIPNKVVNDSLDHQGESYDSNIGTGAERQPESDVDETKNVIVANTCNPIPLVAHLDHKVELPLFKLPIPGEYFSRHRNDVNLGSKGNEENSSQCYKPGTKAKAFRPPPRIGDRRIRKLLKSKYWKVAPKLKNREAPDAGGGVKPVFRKRKTCYTHRRSEGDNFLKRRKLFDQSSVVTAGRGSCVESLANSSDMGTAALQGVKLCIESFRVPELFIEVPETATVGFLKRTVMEAVTAMLEGGLHVGVLLKGKKIRDDNRTLLQSGISNHDNLDALGFLLEPSAAQDPLLLSSKDPPFSLSCDASPPLIRSSATPISDSQFSDLSPNLPLVNTSCNSIDINHNCLSSPTNILTENAVPDSKALVAVPPMSMEVMPVTPTNQKSRRPEFTQRRTRRPFSVSEVEALVQAVEKLGTGRWRDVKLRSFDSANHRTYVDLKDKWKTLVHTAKISPQQRRGEPVPQQLLDRVLSAHAYWSQHHDKQHSKHHSGALKITDAQAESVGA